MGIKYIYRLKWGFGLGIESVQLQTILEYRYRICTDAEETRVLVQKQHGLRYRYRICADSAATNRSKGTDI